MTTRSIVLCFHGIGIPPSDTLDAELRYWIPVDLFAEFIANAASKAKDLDVSLLATFDDGNSSDLDIAAPLLRKHGIAGIFFPCSGRVTRSGYLTEDDIRRLFSLGFEIGSHGVNHVRWTDLEGEALDREIMGSKHELENILGRKIHSAAIPFGAYNRRVLAKLKAAGYTRVYNSDRGFASSAWQRRRWSYTSDEQFEIAGLVNKSSSITHRLLVGVKGVIKALR